jgi:hypothetical protein
MLRISFHDILRATLPRRSGNEGWIGVSPLGDEYHVVTPVDTQIARGVMACNRPTDGTPFGGYSGWLYFRCPPYDETTSGTDGDADLRTKAARQTAADLMLRLAAVEIDAGLVEDIVPMKRRFRVGPAHRERVAEPRSEVRADGAGSRSAAARAVRCPGCDGKWERIGKFLRDPDVRFLRYRVCTEDFPRGEFLFAHSCGGEVGIPVTRLVRSRFFGRSLAGTHACPGLCYFESSDAPCSARCEGSLYRRVARRLKSRRRPTLGSRDMS